jgi:hypothetical protein
MREAQVLQGAVDRIVPPAHDAIDRRDRPFLHETNKADYFQLPAERVVEIGRQISI